MPYQEPDPADPNVLVGVSLPGDEETTREMAYAFAEEFTALGFDETRLLEVFRRPHYEGAHRAFRLLGEEEIGRIVKEAVNVFGRVRVTVRDPAESELVQIENGDPSCRT